ncbi:hypothetical protein EsVE80_14300 [Enterococcus saigonensis]|uniref:Uncharacterized protein n=1 Tax=Enterococcus saigonensis TaxID=1805431 RepID=A0A679IRG5_9ENTE|nr:hypothetical protein EsVE80_14300 [Enterococcus saigonensis]
MIAMLKKCGRETTKNNNVCAVIDLMKKIEKNFKNRIKEKDSYYQLK